jgi:uncharacterized membrane protein AbrB (regulator of aidB expression)
VEAIRRSLLAQGVYYLGTGVAPFISRRAFEAVTGPKQEWWLVETVGVLVTAVGGGVAAAAARDRVTPEITAIAAGCAGGLAAVDIVYVARRRISPAYLADAAAQIALLAAHRDALHWPKVPPRNTRRDT